MDDLISRQKVIDTIEKIKIIAENELHDNEVLKTFNDVLNSLINIISLLPSTQSEPKRGKWVLVCDNNGMHFICNKCGAWRYHQEQKFCGECGADMREVTT